MANKVEQNVSKAKDDFNKAAKKEQSQIAATESGKSTASQVQIDQLERSRSKLKHNHNLLSPGGSKANEVNKAAANAKNAEINRKQEDFRARMQAQKGKAKEAFERSQNQSKEKSR